MNQVVGMLSLLPFLFRPLIVSVSRTAVLPDRCGFQVFFFFFFFFLANADAKEIKCCVTSVGIHFFKTILQNLRWNISFACKQIGCL
jgi:hypothetical protein